MSLTVIVTGSRDWTDPRAVRDALLWALGEWKTDGNPVLKHGGCPQGGADWHADNEWRRMKLIIPQLEEPVVFDAKDYRSFKERNQAMVDSGADVCLAFALRWASGTGQTARMARRAGIETIDIGVNTA